LHATRFPDRRYKDGTFGAAALESGDFQAAATAGSIGNFNSSGSNWYQLAVPDSDFSYINLTGTTQFRLHFTVASDANAIADYDTFYARRMQPAHRAGADRRVQPAVEHWS